MKRLGLVFFCLLSAACHRADFRTVEIRVPEMNSEETAARVRDSMDAYSNYGVIQQIEADISRRVVRITYNSTLIAAKNFEYVIARAGYDANDTRAADFAHYPAPEPKP